jgi:hypothetical protein
MDHLKLESIAFIDVSVLIMSAISCISKSAISSIRLSVGALTVKYLGYKHETNRSDFSTTSKELGKFMARCGATVIVYPFKVMVNTITFPFKIYVAIKDSFSTEDDHLPQGNKTMSEQMIREHRLNQ